MAIRSVDIKKTMKFETTPYSLTTEKKKKGPTQKADSTQSTFQLSKHDDSISFLFSINYIIIKINPMVNIF